MERNIKHVRIYDKNEHDQHTSDITLLGKQEYDKDYIYVVSPEYDWEFIDCLIGTTEGDFEPLNILKLFKGNSCKEWKVFFKEHKENNVTPKYYYKKQIVKKLFH